MDWKCSRCGFCVVLRDYWESVQGFQRFFFIFLVRRCKFGFVIFFSCGVCYSFYLSFKVGVGLKIFYVVSFVDVVGVFLIIIVFWIVLYYKYLLSFFVNYVIIKCSESCSFFNLFLFIVCFLWFCLEFLEIFEYVYQQSCLIFFWKKFIEGSYKFRLGYGVQGFYDF